jgi:SEL1 protein
LGKIYYQGSIYSSAGGIGSGSEGVGRVPQDFHQAQLYFLQIARQVWPRDPPNPLQHNAPGYKAENIKQAGYAPKSAAYLGRMYLRGEGVKQDYAMAMMWFERGAEFDDRECHNLLGVMWRDGLVPGRQDMKIALAQFTKAAGNELAEAHVNLGKYNYCEHLFLQASACILLSNKQTAVNSSSLLRTSKLQYALAQRLRPTFTLRRFTP